MKIELWSDYTCPYCYIGKRRLELALEKLGLSEEVSIELKSYELDVIVIEPNEINELDHLKQRYNLSRDEVNEMIEQIKHEASEIDLVYNFTNMKQQNTFDAHRLMKYAYDQNKGDAFLNRLLQAYFMEAAEISEREVLINLAKEIELNGEEVANLLCLNNYAKKVREDIEEAKEMGIEDIPFFIVDDMYAISGVQSLDVFVEVIKEAHYEYIKKPKSQSVDRQGSYCVGEGCEE